MVEEFLMPVLFIYIEETWPEPDVKPAPVRWTLLAGTQGQRQQGVSENLEDLPEASRIEVIVPACVVLLTSATAPARNRRLFYKSLRFAVEDQIVEEPEKSHVAVGPVASDGVVPAAVVSHQWMNDTLKKLAGAGIFPDAMQVETLFAPLEDGACSVLWNGCDGFVRAGEYSGFPLDRSCDGVTPIALQLAMRQTVSSGNPPARIDLYLTDGAQAPDIELWQSTLGVDIRVRGRLDIPASVCAATKPSLNLLQGDFAPRPKILELVPRLKPTLILVAGIILLSFAVTFSDWALMENEARRLRAEINQSFQTAFPTAKAIVDAPLQMRRNMAELIWRTGGKRDDDLIQMLSRTAHLFTDQIKLKKLVYDKGTLKLLLVAPGIREVETMRGKIEGTGLTADMTETGQRDYGVETGLTISVKNK